MTKFINPLKLPYRMPETADPDLLLEQTIATASSNDTISDMVVDDLFDDPFSPIN